MVKRWGALLAVAVASVVVTSAPTVSAGLSDEYTPGPCISNTVQVSPFDDVALDRFFTNAVGWAYLNEIVQGTTEHEFSPDRPVKRSEFAAMLYRMMCRPAVSGQAPFSDVVAGSFYETAVNWLWSNGFTLGKPGNIYDPEGVLTRGELAAFVFRLVGEPGGAPESPFIDVGRSRFYAQPIDWMFWRGITTGTTPSTYSPESTVTRGQAITFLYRLNIGAAGLIDPSTIPLGFSVVASGLDRPLGGAVDPSSGAVLIIEQAGRVLRVPPMGDGSPDWGSGLTEVLDLSTSVDSSSNERGLLGVAVSPDGAHLYLSFTTPSSVIWEYDLLSGVPVGLPRELIRIAQPFSNHNGGHVAFGPDGALYASFGDGGSGGDPLENGQNTSTVLGSIIRIQPNGDGTYDTPVDNPFVGGSAPEIYLYGVRNPWRFSFDAASGDLWVADVGQNRSEEINRLASSDGRGLGANLGWNTYEGTVRFDGSDPVIPDRIEPVYEYETGGAEGRSVTGGFVYRGDDIAGLKGTYLWADFLKSELRGFNDTFGSGPIWYGAQAPGGLVASFFEDADGEIYAISLNGTVSKIISD